MLLESMKIIARGSVGVIICLGVVACGGGSGGETDSQEETSYSTGRPEATNTSVGTDVNALSDAVGVEGAARQEGSIPAPSNLVRSAVLASSRALTRSAKNKKLGKYNHRVTRVPNTSSNYNLFQGLWVFDYSVTDSVAGGWLVSDNVVYAVAGSGENCAQVAIDGVTTTDMLSAISSLTSASITTVSGDTLSRDTGGLFSLCDFSAGSGVSAASITANVGQIVFTDNSTFNFDFYSPTPPTAVFAQLEGAGDYFIIPASSLVSDNAGNYTITFYGPTVGGVDQVINTSTSGFVTIVAFYGDATEADLLDGNFLGADDETNWSSPVYVDCVAQPVASGDLQFTLTWSNSADLDLHLIEPDTNEIYFANENSVAGNGFLDVDDVDGFGPENIFYDEPIPSGTYSVFVEHYSGAAPAGYTLTVTYDGSTQVYTGTLGQYEAGPSTDIVIP